MPAFQEQEPLGPLGALNEAGSHNRQHHQQLPEAQRITTTPTASHSPPRTGNSSLLMVAFALPEMFSKNHSCSQGRDGLRTYALAFEEESKETEIERGQGCHADLRSMGHVNTAKLNWSDWLPANKRLPYPEAD